MDLSLIIKKLGIDTDDIVNVDLYGSRVYGTYTEDSDYDLLIILKDDTLHTVEQITIDNCDITIILLNQIKTELLNNSIQRIELLWNPTSCKLINNIELLDIFTLDLNMLRTSIATISTKCFAYAKILWKKEHNIKKSKKNIFHSIRYVCFGIQIIKYGAIVDYTEANHYLTELLNDNSDDWNHYNKVYKVHAKQLYKNFLKLII
jgi:predicted nucleotidyltransferase